MVHWSKPCLKSPVEKVWQKCRNHDQKGSEPIEYTRSAGFYKNLVCCRRKCWWERAVNHQKYVPQGNASPDEEVLDPSEVVDGESHLAIYSPHYAGVHCDSKHFIINCMTIFSECLVKNGVRGEEEDNYGTKNSIRHPSKNARPAEEDVLYSLLIQQRILQNRHSLINKWHKVPGWKKLYFML